MYTLVSPLCTQESTCSLLHALEPHAHFCSLLPSEGDRDDASCQCLSLSPQKQSTQHEARWW